MKTFFQLAAVLAAMSFSGAPNPADLLSETKTYGTCGCENAGSGRPNVELTFFFNQTFRYRNSSDAAKPIDVQGRWETRGKKVVLVAGNGISGFHSAWKFDKNEPCVVSRRGLEFIRLCDLEGCK